MRVLFAVAVVFLLPACSGGADPSVIKVNRARGTGGDDATTNQEKPGAPPGKPSADDPPPANDPPPAPSSSSSSSSTPPPPPPTKTTTCTTPKCAAGGGLCGCKSTNAAGDDVALGCQDGACACLVNGQVTTTFEATCDTSDDASSLLLAQCACN